MNALFHKAYDKYLIAVTPDFEVIISEQMIVGTNDEQFQQYLMSLEGKKILMPEKFLPDTDLLAKHFELFQKNQ